MSTATAPRVHDNDRDEITVTLDGKEIRGWSYENEAERRMKMLAAREFCEGWFQAHQNYVDANEALLDCIHVLERVRDAKMPGASRRIAVEHLAALASRQNKEEAGNG